MSPQWFIEAIISISIYQRRNVNTKTNIEQFPVKLEKMTNLRQKHSLTVSDLFFVLSVETLTFVVV